MLTYPVGFLGAKARGPLTISSAAGYSTSSSFTANLGAAGNDIFAAVLCFNRPIYDNGVPSAITVGGLSLAKVIDLFDGVNVNGSIWFGAGPSAGGNQTVAVTSSGSIYKAYKAFVIRGSSAPSFDIGASGTGTSVALRAAKGGVIAAIETTADTNPITWTGATAADNYVTSNGWSTGWATYAAANAEASHSVSVNRSDGKPLVAASFKP